MTEVSEAKIEDRLVAAMKSVEEAEAEHVPTMANLKAKLAETQSAFIPRAAIAIENIVSGKINSLHDETSAVQKAIESKREQLTSRVAEMQELQRQIVKIAAELGHLQTHKIVLDMSSFSHGQALGEIVAQATPEQAR